MVEPPATAHDCQLVFQLLHHCAVRQHIALADMKALLSNSFPSLPAERMSDAVFECFTTFFQQVRCSLP